MRRALRRRPSAARRVARRCAGASTAGAAAGRRTRCPCPGPSLCASTVPPCISTSRLTSVSPMPRPPWERSSDRSTWVNRSKTCGQHLGRDADRRCPAPGSRRSSALPLDGQPDVPALRSVYLAALLSRLQTTCASRVGSPSTRTGSSGSETVQLGACGRRSAGGSTRRRALTTAADRQRLLRSVDLALGDAGHVQQVVHQAGPGAGPAARSCPVTSAAPPGRPRPVAMT